MPRSGKAAFSDHLIFFPAVVTRGGRTTSGRGIAQCFSGRFPRLSGWFHGQYKRPTLCCRDAGLLYTLRACVCVCVCERERERERACVRAAHSVWRWGSQLVSPRARFRVPLKGNGLLILGRILPGNTIAKTFHRWVQLGNSYSFWNSTRSSKNTTQGRKGRGREGGKKGERRTGVGFFLPIQRW